MSTVGIGLNITSDALCSAVYQVEFDPQVAEVDVPRQIPLLEQYCPL